MKDNKLIKQLDTKTMIKKIVNSPITLISLTFSGLDFIKRKIKHQAYIFTEVEKLEGEELDKELNKVRAQSNNFRNKKVVLSDKDKIYSFRYSVKNDSGEEIRGTFEGSSIENVKQFLENEFAEVLYIKPRDKFDIDINFGNKIKVGDLGFFLTQMATYLRAGITLVDSMRIMVKQTTKPSLKKVYLKIVSSLVSGNDFSVALKEQGDIFPELLKSMVKTAELTGDLPSLLDEMAEYYTKVDKNRRALKSALAYPIVIACVSIGAVSFLLTSVVPKFQEMFTSINGKLPAITVFILGASSALQNYGLWIFLGFGLFIINIIYFYKHKRNFRRGIQVLLMKLPIYGDILIANEVSNLTKTFSTLLNHGVFITDSMEILSAITTNEVYKSLIYRCLIGLSKGAKISETFKGEWAFPVVAYEMIVTGEMTGQLGAMMGKVSEHFADIHESKTTALKSLMEPFIIIFLAGIIGFILMSVVIPMFSLYSQV